METKKIKRNGSGPVSKIKTLLLHMQKKGGVNSLSYQEMKRILKVTILNTKVVCGWNSSIQRYGLTFKLVPSEVPGQFKEKRVCFSKPVDLCLSEIDKVEKKEKDSAPVDKTLKKQVLSVVEDLSKKNNGAVKFQKILDMLNVSGIRINSLELLRFFKGEKRYYFSPSADGGEIKVRGVETPVEEAITEEAAPVEEAAPAEEETFFSFYVIISMSKKDLERYFPENSWEIIERLQDGRNIVRLFNLKKEDLKPLKYLRSEEIILDDKVQELIREEI